MKLVKTASGKQTIKISKAEWKAIGKKAGWMKAAYEELPGYDRWLQAPYQSGSGWSSASQDLQVKYIIYGWEDENDNLRGNLEVLIDIEIQGSEDGNVDEYVIKDVKSLNPEIDLTPREKEGIISGFNDIKYEEGHFYNTVNRAAKKAN